MALRLHVDSLAPPDRVLVLAAEVIQAGGLIVYPTDTVYGLGVNAWNSRAICRLQALKRRPENKPVLVIVQSRDAAAELTGEIGESGRALMDAFWPGPLTLLFRPAAHVPPELTRGSGKIGVRVPSNQLCLRLCSLCGCPVTSSSANISGQPVGMTVGEIEKSLGPGVDLYCDAGLLQSRVPSTVVDVSGTVPRLVREGAIAREQLKSIVPSIL